MHKGIVMEITEKTLIVLTADGEFRDISRKNRNCRIGEEIVFSTPRSRWSYPKFFAGTAAAAAIIFGVMFFSGATGAFANKEVVAYVSMDINPSLEMGIDAQRKVREMNALNDDGTVLLRNFSFKGKPIDEVTEALLSKAEENYLSKGEAEIVIASTIVNDKTKLDDATLTEQLKLVVDRHVAKEHPQERQSFAVEAFAAPVEVRSEALQKGISPGKYIVYLNAKNNGVDVPLDNLKKESVLQIAKDSGGFDKLIGSAKITKESIRELLKEEKDGSLDQKLKDKKGDKKDGKETKTPSPKPTIIKPSVPPLKTPAPTPRVTQGKNDDKQGDGKNGKDDKSGKDNKKEDGKKTPTPNNDGKKDDDNKGDDGRNRETVKPPDDPKKPDDPRRTATPSPQRTVRPATSDDGKSREESRD